MKVAACLVALALAGAANGESLAPLSPGAGLARVEAAFTPGDDIEALIVGYITRARTSVQVQAYLFTNRRIAGALANAARRGVEVEVIGDAHQFEMKGLPVLRALGKAGARVYLNAELAASHNKIVIIDGAGDRPAVITGSYNFTQAAQSKNAENVVVITGDRELAGRFVRNFERHRAQSSRYPGS